MIFSFLVSRNSKENFEAVDHNSMYNKFIQTDLTKWNYIGAEDKHIGFMADEFYDMVGHDVAAIHEQKKIETHDYTALAFALIKAQAEKIEKLEQKLN